MTINWQQEAEKFRTATPFRLDNTFENQRDAETDHQTKAYPPGPEPAKALEGAWLTIAERDGFKTLNVDNVAGRIELGSGDEIFGLFGHVDVVASRSRLAN